MKPFDVVPGWPHWMLVARRGHQVASHAGAARFPIMVVITVLVVLKPNKIIHKRTDANCTSFHLRVFLGLLNP
jgi:hypothetical protein